MEHRDIQELRVEEIMNTNWPTLGPENTVEEAIKLFAEARVSGAPVVEDGRLVGIVTEGDLIFQDADVKAPGFLDVLGGLVPLGSPEEYRREAIKSAGVVVRDVMTTDPTIIFPEAKLVEAATVMAEKRRKILPVVEGEDQLVGVLTRMDILTLHVLHPRR